MRLVGACVAAFVSVLGCGAGQASSDVVVVAGTPAPGALSLLTEPDQGISPIYALIGSARESVDLAMYELADPQAAAALEAASARGVFVRVLLDKNREQSRNQAAYDELKSHGVAVTWADSRYAATHEKVIVIDRSVAAVMSLNLTARYYSDTRDFAVLDRQLDDVAAVEQVFDADFRHVKVSPPSAEDLVWSPGSEATLIALVNSATSSLLVENEEMALPAMSSALEAAAKRGVRVTIVMTYEDDWSSDFAALRRTGVDVRTYSPTSWLYIHSKAIVADVGTPHQQAFVGSENFSEASLNRNRELGIVTADPGVVAGLAKIIRQDAETASGP